METSREHLAGGGRESDMGTDSEAWTSKVPAQQGAHWAISPPGGSELKAES